MSTYSLEIKLTGNLAKANRKAVMDAHREAITQQMEKAVDVTYRKIKTFTPEGASKRLIRSIYKEVVNFPSSVEGRVFVKEGESRQYAKPVEFGRRKNSKFPPKGALFNWLIFKLGMTVKEAKQKEWLFRRKIAKDGITPTLMFFKGFYYSNNKVRSIFKDTGKVIKEKLARARK